MIDTQQASKIHDGVAVVLPDDRTEEGQILFEICELLGITSTAASSIDTLRLVKRTLQEIK